MKRRKVIITSAQLYSLLLFTGTNIYYKKEIVKDKLRSSKEELEEFDKKYEITKTIENIKIFLIQNFLERDISNII